MLLYVAINTAVKRPRVFTACIQKTGNSIVFTKF